MTVRILRSLAPFLFCWDVSSADAIDQLVPNDPTSPEQRLLRLLQRAGHDYQVEIRISSRGEQGQSSVAHLTAARDSHPGGDRLRFHLKSDETATTYCLDCAPSGEAVPCRDRPSNPLPKASSVLPGTLLPWEEVLVGSCGTWQVTPLPALERPDEGAHLAFDVKLSTAPSELSWSRTLALTEPETGLPIRFDRLDADGNLLRSVRVLEIGAVGDWEGIRRALIETPDARVLMEIRGIRLGEAAFDPMGN